MGSARLCRFQPPRLGHKLAQCPGCWHTKHSPVVFPPTALPKAPPLSRVLLLRPPRPPRPPLLPRPLRRPPVVAPFCLWMNVMCVEEKKHTHVDSHNRIPSTPTTPGTPSFSSWYRLLLWWYSAVRSLMYGYCRTTAATTHLLEEHVRD